LFVLLQDAYQVPQVVGIAKSVVAVVFENIGTLPILIDNLGMFCVA